jgi:hypothetical protein
MDERTKNIFLGASILEFAIAAKVLLIPPKSNEELYSEY